RAFKVIPQRGWTACSRSQIERSLDEAPDSLRGLVRTESRGTFSLEAREHILETSLRLPSRHAGLQATPNPKPAPARLGESLIVPHHVGRPDVGNGAWLDSCEPALRHPDDLQLFLLNRHPPPQHCRIPAKSA